MKPLVLEVFPLDPRFPVGYVLPRNGYMTMRGADKAAQRKRLSDTELAAEYHQQAAYVEARTHQTTAAHDTRNRDRLDTLYRFATQPIYDQEPNHD